MCTPRVSHVNSLSLYRHLHRSFTFLIKTWYVSIPIFSWFYIYNMMSVWQITHHIKLSSSAGVLQKMTNVLSYYRLLFKKISIWEKSKLFCKYSNILNFGLMFWSKYHLEKITAYNCWCSRKFLFMNIIGPLNDVK